MSRDADLQPSITGLRAPETPQARIGRYVVDGKLGEGGMAETWLCRMQGAKGFSKRVVVKTLKPEVRDAEYETMFADEARIGARLDHPNVARVIDFGEAGDVPYLVQEYVEGPSVYQILHRQRIRRHFDVRLGCRIAADIALALDHAYHAVDDDGVPLRVIHRDVSPSNVLVSRKGVPKLIDFGVAMFTDRETRTQSGVLKGKFLYMAPEVLLREEVSHQSDLYSLGVILYALCVGEPAWTGADEVTQRLQGRIDRPSSRRPDLPAELDDIILTCLHVDPGHRYPSGRALAADLHGWLEANGGPVPDAYLAAEVAALFPDGPGDWMSGTFDPTAASRLTARRPLAPRRPWGWAALGVVLLSATLAAVGGVAVLLAWVVVRGLSGQPEDPSTVIAVSSPQDPAASAAVLLDRAEAAIALGDIAEAASHLRAVAALQLVDPGLLARRERLEASLQVGSRVRAARALLDVDGGLALRQALELDAAFPGQAEVASLLADARARVEAGQADARPPAPVVRTVVVQAPAGAPAAVEAALVVDGSPLGAAVAVDGRPVGVVPARVPLAPGRHEVSVTMPGFARRDAQVDLGAGAVHQLDVALAPAPLEGEAPGAQGSGLLDPFSAEKAAALQDPFGAGGGE